MKAQNRVINSEPLSEYDKPIGNGFKCYRSIFSDLIAGCPAKKAGQLCVYCFNQRFEKWWRNSRGFQIGFEISELDGLLQRNGRKVVQELKEKGVVRINGKSDFYEGLKSMPHTLKPSARTILKSLP